MSERTIDSGLRTSLLANDPFIQFHLIKFEKPIASLSSGGVAEKARLPVPRSANE